MILGNTCTRTCGFCGVNKGRPDAVNPDEPERIAESVKMMKLSHAVITSVTRDDLPDGGASHFSDTVIAVRKMNPRITIETLIPDFRGNADSLKIVLDSGVDILNHNLETVPGLYQKIRPEADYERSLLLLENAKKIRSSVITKTGLMAGLGETEEEVGSVFSDIASAGCDALTIGQYLAPSVTSVPVFEYVRPEQFDAYKKMAESKGIRHVYSGPYIRSSYNAETLIKVIKGKKSE